MVTTNKSFLPSRNCAGTSEPKLQQKCGQWRTVVGGVGAQPPPTNPRRHTKGLMFYVHNYRLIITFKYSYKLELYLKVNALIKVDFVV